MNRKEYRSEYEKCLREQFGLTPTEAASVFERYKGNKERKTDEYPWDAAAEESYLTEEDILKVVIVFGGKDTVLRATGWRPVIEYHPTSPLLTKDEPYWVPPFNRAICYSQTEAIKYIFRHSRIWADMAQQNDALAAEANKPRTGDQEKPRRGKPRPGK